MFDYFTKTLNNGLRVVFVPMRTTSVAVNLLVGVGSKYENPKTRGLSHFLEHMAFKGTPRRPTTEAIAKEMDKIGAIYNASTSDEKISYWVKLGVDNFELGLDFISDIVFHPLLEPKEIEKEKGVIIEEMNMYEDTPSEKIGDLISKSIYGETPLGWEVIGKKETVSAFCRQDFVDYQFQFFQPENMVLAIAGGLPKAQKNKVFAMAEKWFGKKKGRKFKRPEISWELSEKRVLCQIKKTEQTHLAIGLPTFSLFDERKYQASLLSLILGGSMSSRLWLKIREKRGWAYYVYSIPDFGQESGSLAVFAGVKNEKAAEAAALIKEELLKIGENLTEKEVEEAKSGRRGRLMLFLESPSSVATLVGESWLLAGKFEKAEEILAAIKKINLAQLKALAKEFFREDKIYLASIGPDKISF